MDFTRRYLYGMISYKQNYIKVLIILLLRRIFIPQNNVDKSYCKNKFLYENPLLVLL